MKDKEFYRYFKYSMIGLLILFLLALILMMVEVSGKTILIIGSGMMLICFVIMYKISAWDVHKNRQDTNKRKEEK